MGIAKIQPLHPPLVPPKNAVPAGVTAEGQQLYTEARPRSRNQPLYEKGRDGKPILDDQGQPTRIWKKNQLTGEPLLPVNEPVLWTENMLYFLESQGNGNVVRIPYRPPSEADLLAAQRRQKVEQFQTDIAEAFVDLDMEPAEALRKLKDMTVTSGQKVLSDVAALSEKTDEELQEIVAEAPDVEVPKVAYPVLRPGGMYEFSDGKKRRMKKVEAMALQKSITATEEAEEAARVTAKANAEATPDF